MSSMLGEVGRMSVGSLDGLQRWCRCPRWGSTRIQVPLLGFDEGPGPLAEFGEGAGPSLGFGEVQGSLAGLGDSRGLLLRGKRRWWRRWREE